MKIEPSLTLFEAFCAAASECGDEPAFTFLALNMEASTWSYRRLFEEVERIGRRLDICGFDPGSLLGILVESQESQALHYLASLSRGLTPAILTPPSRKLNRDYYLRTTRTVVDYCRFSAVVTNLGDLGRTVPVLRPYILAGDRPRARAGAGDTASGAFVQFSSGTTGIKRGVLVTSRAALEQIAAYSEAIGLSRDDRIVSWLPLYHDMGFAACLNMALACGVHSIMMQPLDWVADPGMFPRAVSRFRATLSWNPNFAYAFMADRVLDRDLIDVDLSSLQRLVNCSEPVTNESQNRFLKRFRRCGLAEGVFRGCYAMAETTFAITHGASCDPGYLDDEGPSGLCTPPYSKPFVSVGRPIEGVELIVVDDAGMQCGDGQLGELYVKSPFNLTGYYNDPESTESAFANGWYRTGDLGYKVGRDFFVIGRKKDMLIVGGVNIYPQDIESLVSEVSGVHPGRAVAFAEFDPASQTERVTVLAEAAPDCREVPLITEIRQKILAAFQIMNFEVHLVPPAWLVKSSAGKAARRANREKWRNHLEATKS